MAVAVALTVSGPSGAAAQRGDGPGRDPAASVGATARPVSAPRGITVAAGTRYAAGAVHRWLLGPHYRDVWATPVRVELLDLDRTAGGLEATGTGGGMQTRSLRFAGADGREYAFRSIDKDPSAILDPVWHGSAVHDIVQDGISAAHPYGALVAAPLLSAAGVLHVEPLLRVMPSDPRLGEYRAEFGGMLGLFEERPDENGGDGASFAGADKVIGSERLSERLAEGPADRVDARAYLRARLMDVFLGDFDRHRDQWRWASFEDRAPRRWIPIPRDRDQVFADFDGVATTIAGLYVPQLVRFGPEYPDLTRLHWNARDIDRWFLAELDRNAWDEVGREVHRALTDAAIEDAVRRLPPEIHRLHGAELAATLRSRRDALPDAWSTLYGLMSGEGDLRATDADEAVRIERLPGGMVRVRVAAVGAVDEPFLDRLFDASETGEIRIHLQGGDDAVVVRGAGGGPTIRVVGGPGDDRYYVDEGVTGVRFYDHEGSDVVTGEAPLDRRPHAEWVWTEDDRDQPLDWGRRSLPLFWSSYGTDLGVFVGGGVRTERYGFRHPDFASAVELRVGVAPSAGKGRIEVDARLNRSGSPFFARARARLSGLDVLHYYGMGNRTPGGAESAHRVDVSRASLEVGGGASIGRGAEVALFGVAERSHTRGGAEHLFGPSAPGGPIYGGGVFRAVGAGARLRFEPLEDEASGSHRIRLGVEGTVFPALLDASEGFGRASARISAVVGSSPDPGAALAVRAGADRLFGRAPWHHAAFLGGEETLRGFHEQRFAGDAALWGGAELRVRLARSRVLVPASLGVFGFVDGGRVFLDDEPVHGAGGGWHTAVGGGLSVRPAGLPYLARLGAARSEESTKVFLTVGLPY